MHVIVCVASLLRRCAVNPPRKSLDKHILHLNVTGTKHLVQKIHVFDLQSPSVPNRIRLGYQTILQPPALDRSDILSIDLVTFDLDL